MRDDAAEKENRKQRGETCNITDHISPPADPRNTSAFLHLGRCAINELKGGDQKANIVAPRRDASPGRDAHKFRAQIAARPWRNICKTPRSWCAGAVTAAHDP